MNNNRVEEILLTLFEEDRLACTKQELDWLINKGFIEEDEQGASCRENRTPEIGSLVLSEAGYARLFLDD